jgi:hypothetical protein
MLSNTYQQGSDPRLDAVQRDPENRLLWRFNRQRLDFEAMRDSLLAVSGALDPTIGGPPTALHERQFSSRRTVYGFIDRQNLDGLYRTFDFAVPDATSPKRFVTTVPQQALFLLNSPFLHEQARRLAAAIREDTHARSASARATTADATAHDVRQLYRRVLGRAPEPEELNLAVDFLRRQFNSSPGEGSAWNVERTQNGEPVLSPWEQLCQVMVLTNEFMFVD